MIEQAEDTLISNQTEHVITSIIEAAKTTPVAWELPFWLQNGILGWANDIFPMRLVYPEEYLTSYWEKIIVFNITANLTVLLLICCVLMFVEAKRYAARGTNVFFIVFDEGCWLTDSKTYDEGDFFNKILTLTCSMMLCGFFGAVITILNGILLLALSLLIYVFGFVLAIPIITGMIFVLVAQVLKYRFDMWIWLKSLRN